MKFDDLTRIHEEEKKPPLSRIDRDFFRKVEAYISELESRERTISRRHSEEAVMLQHELQSAHLMIDRIFKKRIRKIIKMASIKAFSRDAENTQTDTDLMTSEEKEIYLRVLDAILVGKKNTVELILGEDHEDDNVPLPKKETPPAADEKKHDLPEPQVISSSVPSTQAPEAPAHNTEILPSDHADAAPAESLLSPQPSQSPAEVGEETDAEQGKKDLNKEYYLVRVLKDIPQFVGSDERNYILHAQEVAVLPIVNAKALIKRKMAVQIKIN